MFQSLHSAGSCILFFVALPGMSTMKMVAVLSSTCLIPSVFRAISDRPILGNCINYVWKAFDILCVAAQVTSIAIWTSGESSHQQAWSIPVGLILISFGWWEAYLPYNNAAICTSFFDFLRTVRDESLHRSKQHLVNFIVSIWKIVLITSFLFILVPTLQPVPSVGDLFSNVKGKYSIEESVTSTPGRPPSIMLNETYSKCITKDAVPYLAMPDSSDCSGYWVRVCLDKKPSLTYHLCPGSTKYIKNGKSMDCVNAGTCCEADSLVDCTGRIRYENCDNPNLPSEDKFTSDPSKFNEWHFVVENFFKDFYPIIFLAAQVLSTFFSYQLSYFAIETRLQIVGFAIPMLISSITTLVLAATTCNSILNDSCSYDDLIPAELFFRCFDKLTSEAFFSDYWVLIPAFLSQLWLTQHIWTKKVIRLAKTEMVFDMPYYDSLILEQSLLLNRRMDDEMEVHQDILTQAAKKESKILGCATLWHETESEMLDLISSLFRIDNYVGIGDKADDDSFTFEMHIIFDDAYTEKGHINSYVLQLINLLASKSLKLTSKCSTPYGGRLTWNLKHKLQIICHLKDKKKIRIKKRWSQLFYFLYFLDTQTMKAVGPDNMTLIDKDKVKYQNTFVLALDGDSSFRAETIVKLLDHMKKDDKIGAVCGRIHPKGDGFISMYQKFEYAIGHWLQKSTEDVLGNVLCSPGCFSLIRMNALLESHIKHLAPAVHAYSEVTTRPMHYLQHDQGEDRWLCTLLIERGWRIEYSAVSDSYTACPEDFAEFFNQRRRWTPSTVANLIQLLTEWKSLVRHGNLSLLHIIYQILMLAGTAIGPGSIFILLVGGIQMTLSITYWTSFILNIIPIILFILICVLSTPKNQILVAKVLSLIYGFVMITILFSLFLNALTMCPFAPSTLSLIITVGAFVVVGIFHPLEFGCLMNSAVYYTTIPCMYLLLPVYCAFNLDNVSWGTRETSPVTQYTSFAEKLKYIFNNTEEINQLNQTVQEELRNIKDEIKNLNKNTPATVEDDVTDSSDRTWMTDLEGERIHLDHEEKETLRFIIDKYLQPENTNEAAQADLKKGLVDFKNEISLMFVFLNAAWAVFIFLLQLSSVQSSTFTIDWTPCPTAAKLTNQTSFVEGNLPEIVYEYMPLDPINLVFILFFLLVLLFQGKESLNIVNEEKSIF